MCDERERLIEFVYDECDPAERKRVEAHLASCPDCRHEIAALRHVRQDLLAWDVPAHAPIWRPPVETTTVGWWQQVPTWALAAAAGIMLMAGAAGGAVTAAVATRPADPVSTATLAAPSTIQAEPRLPAAAQTVGLTAEDLSAAERRWLDRMRAEFGAVDQKIQLVASKAQAPGGADAGVNALVAQVKELRTMSEEQLQLFLEFHNEREAVRQRDNLRFLELERRITDLTAMIQVAR